MKFPNGGLEIESKGSKTPGGGTEKDSGWIGNGGEQEESIVPEKEEVSGGKNKHLG